MTSKMLFIELVLYLKNKLKGIAHPHIKNDVIIYSPSCRSMPECLSFFIKTNIFDYQFWRTVGNRTVRLASFERMFVTCTFDYQWWKNAGIQTVLNISMEECW